VHDRPADIRDSDVAAALARQWPLTVQELTYLPVGFGGYHWLAVDQTGSRWFVTVSDLAAPWVPDLPAAMQTASWLASEARLEFVVAPVPTRAGEIVGSLDSQHALTLFPYLEAVHSGFDDSIDGGDRDAIIDLLAALHTAAQTGIHVPRRPLELANRQAIEQAWPAWTFPGMAAHSPSRAVIFWPGTNDRCIRPSRGSTPCSVGFGRLADPMSSRMASPTPAICCAPGPDCAWSTGT
jgi:spectinomycin phosphotransferase